jgi:ABC-2 type transport system permease protein
VQKNAITPARLLGAFIHRDFRTESSYKTAFLLSVAGIFLRVLIFYVLSRFIGDSTSDLLADYGGDYFSFVLIGIAFGGYFGTGLTSFSRGLRQAQTTGTLEAMMMTPAPVPWLIVGSAAWSYLYTTLRVLIYLLLGALLLGLDLKGANYPAAFVGLFLALISFAGIGIGAASIIMVVKRGEPFTALFGNLANLIGGVFFPVTILPDWLETVARLLPITSALRVMRLSLLVGASWSALSTELLTLALFALLIFPSSVLLFRFAVDRAKSDGSLAHY